MTVKELYDNLYNEKTPRNPRLFIDSYEKNYVVISNTDLTNLVDYNYAMQLTCDYAILLEDLGYLKKSIPYLDKAIELMENFPDYQTDKLFKIQPYESLKFHKARALFNLKKYDESRAIFKELNRTFPKNDKYLGWFNGIRNKSIDRLTWIATGIMSAILMLITFLKGRNAMFDRITYWLLFSSFLFFIVCLVWNVLQRIRNRKNNAT